jgi:hypothetical protein
MMISPAPSEICSDVLAMISAAPDQLGEVTLLPLANAE